KVEGVKELSLLAPHCVGLPLKLEIQLGVHHLAFRPAAGSLNYPNLIKIYCQLLSKNNLSNFFQVTLNCKDEDNNPTTMLKKVQIITNCSCSSCMETSKIKPDYNTLLHSLADDTIEENVNHIHETPDLLLNPNLNSSRNVTKDGVEANERFMQYFKLLKDSEKLDEANAKELLTKLEDNMDLENLRELLKKYSLEEHHKHHHHKIVVEENHEEETDPEIESENHHHSSHHLGPHHSIVLESDVKEKIDVEPHYLHPAVAGQEISYHDNVLVDKTKEKKDF
ncbi:GSCOCG00013050001-RA-CDS, partial [Cotesia congregata]